MRSQFLTLVAACVLASACGAPGEETSEAGDDLTESGQGAEKIDPNRLLEDEDLVGGTGVTAADVQSFLERKSSFLATFTEAGDSAAKIIVEKSREKNVNPIYMVARIQLESSLVENRSRNANVSAATGCGCPDGQACAVEYKGFASQIKCAANLLLRYFNQLETSGHTVSGWAVGTAKQTLDPCTVTPKNKATSALYTYTPWVGAYSEGCGSSKWGGSTGMARLVRKYREEFPVSVRTSIAGGSTPTPTPATPGTPASGSCDGSLGPPEPRCSPQPSPAEPTPFTPTPDPPPSSFPSLPSTPTPPSSSCVPRSASEVCESAFSSMGVECGLVSDGCGGTVNCDNVPAFGCFAGETCSSNRCMAVSGGCVTGGCSAGETCNANNRCEKPAAATPATPGAPGPEAPPPAATTPPAETPPAAREAPTTKGGDVGADKDDDAKTKTKSKSKPKAESSGCNAAPGTGVHAEAPALAILMVAPLLGRRRRSAARARS